MKKSTKGKILSALMGIPLVTVMATSSLLPGTSFVSNAEEPEQTATSPSDHDTETGNEDDAEIKNEGIDSTEEIVADETTTEEGASEDAVTGETTSEETASEETEEVSSEEVDAKETEEASSDQDTESDKEEKIEEDDIQVYLAEGAPSNAQDGYEHEYEVWDFAGDYLADTDNVSYNNNLSVETINGLYGESVTAGSTGVTLGSFDTVTGLSFYSAKTNNRLRSTNENISRYDDKNKTDASGNTYRGFIYSNSGSTNTTGLKIESLGAGDIVYVMAGSNGNAATYAWGRNLDDEPIQSVKYNKTAGVEELIFYVPEGGDYYLWCLDEKLVVARVYIERANEVTVTGDIDTPSDFTADDAELVFTQLSPDGNKIRTVTTEVEENAGSYSYSVVLDKMYDYTVELTGANGFVIDSTKLTDGLISIDNISDNNLSVDLTVSKVNVVTVKGQFKNLPADKVDALELTITNHDEDRPYTPVLTKTKDTNLFTLELESGQLYDLEASGVDDYELETQTITADEDGTMDIVFKAKDTHMVNITVSGPSEAELSELSLTLTILKTPITGELDSYSYSFTGQDVIDGAIALRDGQYHVEAALPGYEMALTSDIKVNGEDTSKEIVMKKASEESKIAYSEIITVGTDKDYKTISDAIEAIRHMERDDSQRVTIKIDPGNYQEMLIVDVDNVSLVNAAGDDASIELADSGVSVSDKAVRITSYYGHGYTYYSMGEDYRYDEEVLKVNQENGYPSVTNPGSGTATMWNATVYVNADGFEAEGIIFENSFNQYVSELAAEDTIVAMEGAKEGSDGTRNDLEKGSTVVQQKSYVERASALALGNNLSDIVFTNCKVVGRQDTLYGGKMTYAEFNNCEIYGAVDYIFGGMTAIFYQCELKFNTTDNKNDVGYITAAQQSSGRGYLMYECHITSVEAGTDVDSKYYSYTTSKPGYFGRPWQANTSEVVFYNTTIDECDSTLASTYGSSSLIQPAGWLNSLGGEAQMYEYGTTESSGVDNSSARIASWTTWTTSDSVLTTPYLADGTKITLDAFRKNKSGDTDHAWDFSTYGSSISTDYNTASVSADGTITVSSTNGKGKLVPASTDGLAFYYVTIDAANENFTLEADIAVDSWKLSNGQEGFGIMAADAVGINGDTSTFWNNSYMLSATKVSYTGDNGNTYTMKIGVGAQEKKGVTADNLETIKGGDISDFSSTMYTLETSAADEGLEAGTYNMCGNYTNTSGMTDVSTLTTTFHMSIRRNNTGYVLTYSDTEGNIIGSKLFYHPDEGDNLTMIDKDHIYVGFFAARNATIKVTNTSLTTINPSDDDAKEEHPLTYTDLVAGFESADFANQPSYELVYYGNADGILSISDEEGNVVLEETAVTANSKTKTNVTLKAGTNTYVGTFTPDPEFRFDTYEVLTTYDTVTFTITVNYEKGERYVYYVSPDGSKDAKGTKEDPMDIYTAVKVVEPGDKILLAGGTYNLTSTVVVERGIDGTKDQLIYMIADPESKERPVFDFGGNCAGMILASDYWYFQGFDVTNSQNAQKGLQLSGSYNTLDSIHAYRNGNTGIQVSRYKSTDTFEDWPSYNTILNCTSFLNADAGYEDADGFAAKLTVGEGNVFDGCIAAYNADDGWDLFAKVETGAIGAVTIKNSVAFMNGYVLDEVGNLIDAGNGNGFKMGGSSIAGGHMLINSVAFCNKAKGIDSNSCPDIQVTNSTSYNNGSYNVAFYTNDASNTAFLANGVISYRNDGGTDDQIKLKGSQDEANVYNESNYYMISGSSTNTESVTVDDSWFVSVDADAAIGSSMTSSSKDLICGITRNEDGTINMNGFLVLAESSGKNAGATVEGQNSEKIEVPTSEANMSKDTSEDLDGKFVRKWFNVYYQLSDGTYLTGLHKIEGNLYFFYESGAMARNTFITVSEKTYYFDDMGQAVKGFLTLWFFNTYYFGEDFELENSGFFTVGDFTYYARQDGRIVNNDFVNISQDDGTVLTYFFDSKGHMATGFVTRWIWNTYYFDSNGVMVTNSFVSAGDSTYYFAADGLMVRYWQTIDGKQYYFGSDGKMVKGCIEMWWNIYVFDDNGVLIESHSIYERACNWANKRFGITIRI
ncbi:Putative cell wall binding repeat-containing protein [Butyrivibrio fibrisolvens DSM 3071]|uniref:Putative cell wall binding repeat-containing protein n=1 Tax=Butyrivibrio fibrisolvens DSM 3071 TaxID=1121131 RepID=A0A1M6G673_BUTFI|nr:pectinesterase family protein [Butyrivibrio fibrisolvens]SHJ05297.1 Putative cell wall binding repeat-containing protein [Butyrivibrio fibrisolvens DSM 3071]